MAIVGASANSRCAPVTTSWTLLEVAQATYELYLVNPTISEVDGTPVYPSLADLPVVPDLVDVFRRHEHLPSVLDDTIAVGAQRRCGCNRVCGTSRWPATAKPPGLQVVMDRCLKVDHARLFG